MMKNKFLFIIICSSYFNIKMMSTNNTGSPCKSIKVGYINLRAQSGFGSPKQAQVEHFVKLEKFDILHLQEAQILEDTFENCSYITSNYSIITNNARNQYGTASLVANSLEPVNIKMDTQGRVIVFDVGDFTFANIYLPSGNDTVMRNLREEYISLSIPELHQPKGKWVYRG